MSNHVKSTDKYRTDDGTVHEVLWIGRHDEHCATDTQRTFYRASQPANDDKAMRDSGGGVGMVCSIRRLRRARGVQLSDLRALPAAARGVVVDRREGVTVGAGLMWALLETLPTNAMGRLMARSCRANGCQPVGTVH